MGLNENLSSKSRSGKRASIDQVAKRAGVSTATVSRVLNNPSLVTASTAARVEKAIADLRYRPNMFAKGLMMRRSGVLALVLPDIHGEFYSELLRFADQRAHELGYHMLASSRPPFTDADDPVPPAFGLIDGMILMLPTIDRSAIRQASRLDRPIVLIDADGTADGFDSILINNDLGARAAVGHILQSVPPERCVYLGGEGTNADAQARAHAFRSELSARGVQARADQVVFGPFTSAFGSQWAYGVGAEGLRGMGVIAGNDEVAMGVMSAAADLGVAIPGQLRVVGFDNTRLSELIRPRLSSVRVPLAEIGEQAVALLVRRIEQVSDPSEVDVERIEVPTELLVRDTS